MCLVFEGEDVLELLLEDGEDGIQSSLVFHSQIILQLFIHRLNLQNDDFLGLFLQENQNQIFLAIVLDAV